jgi:hypothetical protein
MTSARSVNVVLLHQKGYVLAVPAWPRRGCLNATQLLALST